MLPPNYEDGPAFIIYFNGGEPLQIPTNQEFVDFFSKDQPQTNPSSTSKKQYTIADIKYLVALLYTKSIDSDTIGVVKEIVREKYDCRFPVVFYICNDGFVLRNKENAFADYFLQAYGEDEFLRTYGLGQFLYSAEQHKFLLPEETGNEFEKTNSGKSEEMDDNKIIAAFMEKQPLLNDLQMEHLKMYITPKNIIQRLRHDGSHSRTYGELKEYEEKLRRLLDKVGRIDDFNKEILSIGTQLEATVSNNDRPSNNEYERYVLLCNKAEAIVESYAFGKSTPSPIYALLLDDCCEDSDIQEFVKAAESKNIYIATVKTVASAKEELTKQTKLSELKTKAAGNNGEEQIDNNPRYTVILVDLLLKEQHNATGSNSNCNLLVSRQQGYDFISELAREGKYYGVILLSTLPRNFKVQVAGTLPMRMRNFPYKDGHKLEKEEYQQMLIDMIVEAHEEFNEEAVFRAFTKRGFAMHYIRYMIQNKGFDDVNRETEKAIKSFLDYVNLNSPDNLKNEWEKNDKNKGKPKNGDESKWLSKLTTKYAPIMNEEDINASVEEFLNNIYSWSWESYCEQGCPSAPLSDEQKSKINKYCREQISKNDNPSNPIIKILKNNDNIISAFIEDCYNSTLSFKTTFELYKQKEEVRDFVKRLFIYKDAKNKYPDNDSLKTRFIARRLALFLFFWANLSEYASENYVGKEVPVKTSKKKGEKETQEPSKHTLTAFDYVNQILNRIGKASPTEYDNPTSLVNNGVWLKAIYFQKKRNPECLYMTAEEQAFFYELFNKTEDYQFPLKQMVEDEQLDKILKINDRKMCSELIYYFK